ncbi:hypothetical protein ACWGK1_41630, partial [Streptomyces wedmorensis]
MPDQVASIGETAVPDQVASIGETAVPDRVASIGERNLIRQSEQRPVENSGRCSGLKNSPKHVPESGR